MKRLKLAGLAALTLLAATGGAQGQVAGTTTVGVAVAQLQYVATGWSAKRQILGRTIYNEAGDKVGKVDDLIIAPDREVSFAIVGAGGFVGLHRHQVAIPVAQLTQHEGALVLPGATRAAIKSLPNFEYVN
jgi:hypothetical protein